jgi:hypothetical protein
MNQYTSKLREEGYDVTKVDDEWRPQYFVEVDDLEALLNIGSVVEHEVIYYKDGGVWTLEIYDGWRE